MCTIPLYAYTHHTHTRTHTITHITHTHEHTQTHTSHTHKHTHTHTHTHACTGTTLDLVSTLSEQATTPLPPIATKRADTTLSRILPTTGGGQASPLPAIQAVEQQQQQQQQETTQALARLLLALARTTGRQQCAERFEALKEKMVGLPNRGLE